VHDKQTNKLPLESSIKTYIDLEVAYLAHLESENKSEQDLKNFRSSLNSWCEVFKLEKSAPILTHFGEKFSHSLDKYKANQIKSGAKDSTIASKASKLKKLNEFLTARISFESLPPNFGDRLQHLLRKAGFTSSYSFWRLCIKEKCRSETVKQWCEGAYPSERSRELVSEIETLLEAPAGTLTSLLRYTFNQKKSVRRETASSIRLRLLKTHRYQIWEKHLEEEFQGLVEFKCATVLPEGIQRFKNSRWTDSEGGQLGSANILKSGLRSFFGYLCLPKDAGDPMFCGMGYSKDKLTLGLLADKSLVENFVTGFKKLRSSNKYNNSHASFLSACISLLRPETGYLFQCPEFAVKIGLSGDVEEWQAKCVDTRNRLLKVLEPIKYEKDSKGRDYQMGRDPKEPIADILVLPNPVEYMTEILGIMLNDLDTYPPGVRKAVFFRDILLIALLIGNPLRIRMFSIMKFGRNLIRKDDGSYWISFKREDFKNRKSLPSDYEVLVAPELIPLINRYIEEFRPLLSGAEKSDYVFLKEFSIERKPIVKTDEEQETLIYKVKSVVKNVYNISPLVLSERVSIRIQRYLPLSPGFRAHAFRHIVATSIIKTSPEMGFFLASKVLHDKLETVEDNYAHLKTHEFFEPYNRFISGFLKKIIDTDGSGKPSSENGGGGK
jgi:hypothetical protein